ncbi:GGDEF domain-containing protein [Pelagibacterium sp.]|uniref:GGDEF domain-containing protein n=1 Tax=Pelagibacterium sp. TaxID=1967288 RepID=UPI003A93549D
MSGALLLYWVIVGFCAIKSAAFLALFSFDPKNRAALWFSGAFVAAATSFLAEIVLTTAFYPSVTRMVIALSIVVMFILVAYGYAVLYKVHLHPGGGWAIAAASALLYWIILDLPREDFTRQLVYQLPYALLSLLSLSVITRARSKRIFDWVLIVLLALLALHFVAKPFLALWTGGVGVTALDFVNTVYAGVSTAVGAVLLLFMATTAFGLMLSDTTGRLIQKAERDDETGLLNRAGFTNHAERSVLALGQTDTARRPELTLTLIGMNTPLHPRASDRHLAEMAELIGDHVPSDALVGRMADCDFAVLSPATNLMAARANAEALRLAANARLSEAGRPVTLSVGITEREKGEVYADLLARGLWALDEAEKSGGNCVRLAGHANFVTSGERRAKSAL